MCTHNDHLNLGQDLGKPTFWAQAKFSKNSVENLYNDFKIKVFLHILIKQLLKLLSVKFLSKSFFFLGDMDDYIRPTNVPKR